VRKKLIQGHRLAVALAAIGAMTLAGCSGNGDDTQPVKDSDKSGSVQGEKTGDKKQAPVKASTAVGKALLNDGDIGPDFSQQDSDDGLDAPTNDICGKTWATNKRREARQQDFFWDSSDKSPDVVVSNEVVVYKAGEAPDALAEIKTAVADCDGWKHDQGEMSKLHVVDPPSDALKGAIAWEGKDDRDGTDYSYGAVYQIEGDVLSAVYVWARDSNKVGDMIDDLTPKAAAGLHKAQG
jgi:hypothetical protein